jgi:hypothetical protein
VIFTAKIECELNGGFIFYKGVYLYGKMAEPTKMFIYGEEF